MILVFLVIFDNFGDFGDFFAQQERGRKERREIKKKDREKK